MKFATSLKRLGIKAFKQKNKSLAIKLLSASYSINPDEETQIYILICYHAYTDLSEAVNIFELYTELKGANKKGAIELARSLIDTIELKDFLPQNLLPSQLFPQDTINYEEFKGLLKGREKDFKDIFTSVMFSTKVVITQKDDFFEFIEKLIKNGFTEMALSYIDSASNIFPPDERIRDLLNLIKRIDSLEAPNK